jgi:hypothetical protein
LCEGDCGLFLETPQLFGGQRDLAYCDEKEARIELPHAPTRAVDRVGGCPRPGGIGPGAVWGAVEFITYELAVEKADSVRERRQGLGTFVGCTLFINCAIIVLTSPNDPLADKKGLALCLILLYNVT